MYFEKKISRSDMLRCALCNDAPCSSVCKTVDPAAKLFNIWFDNEREAASKFPADNPCASCGGDCEKACVRPHEVPIRKLMMKLQDEVKPELEDDQIPGQDLLKTDFCGIPIENPFFLSSSVVASTYDMCARAFEAGWAGVSFKTVCSIPIHEVSPRFSAISGDNGEIIGFKNIEQLSDHSAAENMQIFRDLKKNYPSKFILASIMGKDEDEWESLTALCEENGADAVELNFSCPNMAEGGLGSDIGQIPELVERFTAAAKRRATIPVLAKLTPNVARMSPAAEAAVRGGADGVSAINTIKSIVGINPHTYVSAPAVHGQSAVGGYSGSAVKPIALRFIAELGKNPQMAGKYISGMGGVETWMDAFEFIALGSGNVQVTTAVMKYGYRIIEELIRGLSMYLTEKGFHSVNDIRGIALDSVSETTDGLERDTVVFPRFNPDKCIGCGRCMISCMDGGHQAISLDSRRRPKLNGKKCVGCHLCILVCPQNAISPVGKRILKPVQNG